MNGNVLLAGALFALAASCAGAATSTSLNSPDATGPEPLASTIQKLDAEFFGSFNQCSAPDQLKKHGSYLNPKVEFYHDKSGVTWTSQAYIE
ncbi:MAG TPA: DUF4440 domain-containing protein, partial [Dyella sp.]|nr:DUF4440 domain-containing protein [Dyella sp.]